MTLRLPIIGLIVAFAASKPALGHAQVLDPLRVDSAGAWHTAELLRDRLRTGDAGPSDSLALAVAELDLGRAERARAIANRLAASFAASDVVFLVVRGEAEYGVGNFEQAGRYFARAADGLEGSERGVVCVRAGVALERAGLAAEAAPYYRRAAVLLPEISGWLAIREARVTVETVRALTLLRRAPPEALAAASQARGTVLVSAGDTVRALAAFSTAKDWIAATRLAQAVGDTATGRLHAYRALESTDTAAVRVGLAYVLAELPLPVGHDAHVLASAHRRLDQLDAAIGVLESAIAAGDSSAATLRRLGDLLSSDGRRRDALRVFERAIDRDAGNATDGNEADEIALAEYRRARLLIQIGRASDGYDALEEFADRHAEHISAPHSLYLVADWHLRAGRRRVADSVFAQVASRWPESSYGGQARMTLAASALSRRDTAAAREWYLRESRSNTADRLAAAYLHAELLARSGDSAAARAEWQRLVREDPVGYYGMIARRAANLDEPTYDSRENAPDHGVRLTLKRLEVLRQSYLDAEAHETLRYQLARENLDTDELLALAEGLIGQGWVQEGVNLGWRASRARTLRDSRVLRVIFPWPLRSLIEREAAEHEIDPYLLAALIRQESNFRPAVTSRAGARGLMQLMPSTAADLARRRGVEWDSQYLTSAAANLHVGAAHLAALLRVYDGAVIPALAAYNAGGRPVARWLRYPEAADPVRFVERIPYVETRGYLRAVLRNWSLYRSLYPVDPMATSDP